MVHRLRALSNVYSYRAPTGYSYAGLLVEQQKQYSLETFAIFGSFIRDLHMENYKTTIFGSTDALYQICRPSLLKLVVNRGIPLFQVRNGFGTRPG